MSTVFVSGVSRGIGLGLASRYLEHGHRVIGTIRSENPDVEQLASRHGDSLLVVKMDVADRASVDAAAAEVAGKHEALDLLICSAAVNSSQAGVVKPLADIDDAEMSDTLNVNVMGPLRLVRALLPLLRKGAPAKVVLMSSGAGSVEMTKNGGMIAYCVSKAALNMLSRSLHFLLAEDDISVLALSPGWVKTDMGGPDALISVEESTKGIAEVISRYGEDSTPFQDYTGKALPW